MFVMPENWKPGDKVTIPDPNNPGRMIEVPFEALDIQAIPPKLGADVGNDTSNAAQHIPVKKGKKKKKKRLINSIIKKDDENALLDQLKKIDDAP